MFSFQGNTNWFLVGGHLGKEEKEKRLKFSCKRHCISHSSSKDCIKKFNSADKDRDKIAMLLCK